MVWQLSRCTLVSDPYDPPNTDLSNIHALRPSQSRRVFVALSLATECTLEDLQVFYSFYFPYSSFLSFRPCSYLFMSFSFFFSLFVSLLSLSMSFSGSQVSYLLSSKSHGSPPMLSVIADETSVENWFHFSHFRYVPASLWRSVKVRYCDSPVPGS